MATAFENFVNTELPKRIATNESPTTPQAGDIPVFTGVGLLTESKTASEAGLATETFATDAADTAETNAKSYADGLITSIYKFQTTYNPQTTGNFPTTANTVGGVAIKKGFTWVISGVIGQYTFQGVTVDNGDTLLALVDNASATSAADWHITEKNLGYTPENVSNKYSNDDLEGGVGTYPETPNVKTYVDNGLSGKQNTLADVITADTYGNSTQYPVITFNAKGIATGVTLQTVPTPTFTDANFSVQKAGSPSIAASWSLTALTASRVHTYPDKAIDFGDLPSVATTDSNSLSGTRTRILGGQTTTVAGTDNIAVGCTSTSLASAGVGNYAEFCRSLTLTSNNKNCRFTGLRNDYGTPLTFSLGGDVEYVTYSGWLNSVLTTARLPKGYRCVGSAFNNPSGTGVTLWTTSATTLETMLYGVSTGSAVSLTCADDITKLPQSPVPSVGFHMAIHELDLTATSTADNIFIGRRIIKQTFLGGTVTTNVETIGTDMTAGGFTISLSVSSSATVNSNYELNISVRDTSSTDRVIWQGRLRSLIHRNDIII